MSCLALFETPAGYALFKVDKSRVADVGKIASHFATPEAANKLYVRTQISPRSAQPHSAELHLYSPLP